MMDAFYFPFHMYITIYYFSHVVLGLYNFNFSCPINLKKILLSSFYAGLVEVGVRALLPRWHQPGFQPISLLQWPENYPGDSKAKWLKVCFYPGE